MSTIKQLQFSRLYTLGRLEKAKAEAWDTKPAGFNNTIRWNAGHIFVTMEIFLQVALGNDYEVAHPEWAPLFKPGSNPEAWDGQKVPSNEELLAALQQQTARATEALEGKLDNELKEPFVIGPHTMLTVDAVVQVTAWHEGVHAGIIHGLNSATAL